MQLQVVLGPEAIPGRSTAIADALRALPQGERDVVLLKLIAGWSFAEIAAVVGASEPACRMRLMRGLTKLRVALVEKGIEP